MEATPREVRIYITPNGKRPYKNWLDSLKDIKAVAKIEARIDRIEEGNFGDVKGITKGVCELRIDYGPGRPSLLWTNRSKYSATALWWR